MRCGQMGPRLPCPGTGKTSLVSLLADILGLSNNDYPRYSEVAVEKGWTSRRDLIGYYNPLTKTFDAANKGMFSALSILNEECAQGIKDFPYMVLLDEANLSPMEHYWADFMGLCDLDKRIRRVSLSTEYEFTVPETLRFVATINMDHTTEILSPRLIDRAWIIKLEATDIDIDDIEEIQHVGDYPTVPYSVFEKFKVQTQSEIKLDEGISDKFTRIRALCRANGIGFSPRIVGMIKRYCMSGSQLMQTDQNNYVALDYAVAQKILPMINGFGEKYQQFISDFLAECDQTTMPKCYKILSDIQKKGAGNMQYYQYFAR